MKPLEIIIVGAGMYVCGKGTEGYGTILPAVFEAWRGGMIKKIHIAAATQKGAEQVHRKAAELKKIMGVTPDIIYYPSDRDDPSAYQAAISSVTGPAAALISVPDHLHFEITAYCLEHDLHVQVVKPLVPTVKETLDLIALQKRHRVHGVVEFHKRFDEANLKLFDLIKDNTLGELLNFRINFSQRKIIPTRVFRSWVETTDVFQYLGVHYVDLIHFLTNAQPKRVMTVGLKKYLSTQGVDNYDTMQTLIEWRHRGSTFLSSHLTGWIDPDSSSAMSDQRLEVIGTKGRYQSNQKSRGVTLSTDDRGVEEINPYFCQFYPDIDGHGKRAQGYGPRSIIQFLQDTRRVIEEGKDPVELTGLRATFASSLPVSAVLEASNQSLNNENGWVEVARIIKEAKQ
ncbi:MAG TPA: Gfo/Idh/MocA family oxidoreductase [Desulfobacterales bacterium]|nr:Gfo/Idh/MocA family oxidoreductase [Desulfobacterales bacterium]